MCAVRSPAELVDAFRAQGLKVTPQRQLLFRLLYDNQQHPSADALFATASAQMPGISLRTVYQTLTDLTAMGELQQVTFDTGPAHFDPNLADHHHAVCNFCGTIRDVYVDGADRLAIEGRHLEYLAEVGDPASGEPIGDTEQNFKASIAGETYEYTQMYPGFAKTARDEGFDEVADWFETLARAEKSHAGRFGKGLELIS